MILPSKCVLFDSLINSDPGIFILLPGPSSTAEKDTLLGMKSSFPNERNLKTENGFQKQNNYMKTYQNRKHINCLTSGVLYIICAIEIASPNLQEGGDRFAD